MGLIILILGIAVLVKASIMLSIEALLGIIGVLIAIPLLIKLFIFLDSITMKGFIKISAFIGGFYGLVWCWEALPA